MVKIPLAGMFTLENKWLWKRGKHKMHLARMQPGLWIHVNLIYVNFTSEEVPYRVHMCYRDHQTEQGVHHRNQLPIYCSPNLAGRVVRC